MGLPIKFLNRQGFPLNSCGGANEDVTFSALA
jgi:hypothetical protein